MYLRKEEWKYYAIYIENDGKYKGCRMCIGIKAYNEPNAKNKICKKDYCAMNCLEYAPENKFLFPYGWEFLPDNILYWDYHITEEVVNGEVYTWLKDKIDEILSEIDERNLRMP